MATHMTSGRTTSAPTTRPESGPGLRHEIAAAAWVLVLTAGILWGVLFGVGHALTHEAASRFPLTWDRSVDAWFASHRTGTWNSITHYTTDLAETLTVVALGLVAAAALRLWLHRWRESVFLATALIGEVSIFLLTTLVVDRPRPPVTRLDAAPPTSSFPSGHTAAALALYGSLAILVWRLSRSLLARLSATMLAFVIVVGVALARLYRGEHFPTDVIAGGTFALIWVALCSVVVLRRAR